MLNELNHSKFKTLKYENISNSTTHQIDVNFNEYNDLLRNKILSKSVELGSISETKDGIIQSKIPDVLFLKAPIDEFSKPLLFGRNINRYSMDYDNNWVNYNEPKMKEIEMSRNGGGLRLRVPEIFERDKILTRQTADEIIATYDTDNMYYANTIHGTTIIDKSYSPLYVVGILNSKLETWYYRNVIAEKGKVFAQIKISLLRTLPILDLKDKEENEIIELVKEIYDNQSKKVENMNKIDQLIYNYYGLSESEIELVEKEFINE